MMRRLFVPAIVSVLTLGVAPSPSFGLGASGTRPRFDDHYRCMYRCDERGDLFRPRPRPWRPDWGSWPSRPRPRPPARPSWHRPGCWLFCSGWDDGRWGHGGHGGWGHGGWGHGGWGQGGWRHGYHWYDDDRHDRYDRDRDRDNRGYDAHRHHPRDRDF